MRVPQDLIIPTLVSLYVLCMHVCMCVCIVCVCAVYVRLISTHSLPPSLPPSTAAVPCVSTQSSLSSTDPHPQPPTLPGESCSAYTRLSVMATNLYETSLPSSLPPHLQLCARMYMYMSSLDLFPPSLPSSLPPQLQFHVSVLRPLHPLLIHTHSHQHFLVSPVLCTHTYNVSLHTIPF